MTSEADSITNSLDAGRVGPVAGQEGWLVGSPSSAAAQADGK
jgi:hypothetical protein